MAAARRTIQALAALALLAALMAPIQAMASTEKPSTQVACATATITAVDDESAGGHDGAVATASGDAGNGDHATTTTRASRGDDGNHDSDKSKDGERSKHPDKVASDQERTTAAGCKKSTTRRADAASTASTPAKPPAPQHGPPTDVTPVPPPAPAIAAPVLAAPVPAAPVPAAPASPVIARIQTARVVPAAAPAPARPPAARPAPAPVAIPEVSVVPRIADLTVVGGVTLGSAPQITAYLLGFNLLAVLGIVVAARRGRRLSRGGVSGRR